MTNPRASRWLAGWPVAILALALGGCITSPEPEIRLRIGMPTERLSEAVVPSNADIRVECDFEDVAGTQYGYSSYGARVRCPEDDVERYLGAIGFASGPHVEDPPDVEVVLRFDPESTPRMTSCTGSQRQIPVRLRVLDRFDPSQVAYSSPVVGTLVEIRVVDRRKGDRYLIGRGYAEGIECGETTFVSQAEARFLSSIGQRIATASFGALDSALFGRSQTRPLDPVAPPLASRSTPSAAPTPAPLVPPVPSSSLSLATSATASSPASEMPPAAFGRYSALVIGVDRYEHLPVLGNAIRDATAVGALLRDDYGYDVTELANPTRAEILQALLTLRRRLEPQDNLLIYYAGHGWLDADADAGYWLPADAQREDPTHWISNETITAQLRALRAKHVLVVADSCYSGKLVRGIKVGARPSDYFARMASRRARVVMSSGGLEPVIDSGGREGHSIFASAFLATLRANDSVVDGSTVFSQIRRPVMTNADQIPEYADIRKAGHDGGDFLFVRKSAR